MIKHYINPGDQRYLFLKSDNPKEMHQLQEHLNKIPQYMFLPSYTSIPKPEVHLDSFEKNGSKIYFCFSGLYLEILNWCREKGIQTTLTDDIFYKKPKLSYDEFCELVKSWNLTIAPREYQLNAAYNIISYRQSLSEIATRAGKTLLAAIIFRYLREVEGIRKILMIVPSIQLVKQGHQDFSDYNGGDYFRTETVWAKGESVSCPELTIGTFQSLVKRCDKRSPKYDSHYFDGFDCVCVDEVHNAKAASIKMILSQPFMKGVRWRFGFSGTLPLKGTLESFSVQELMGGKIQDISPKELIDGGFISDLHITQYRIGYPELEKSSGLRDEYIRCAEYLCSPFTEGEKKGSKILRPADGRDMCMIHEKKLPYALRQMRERIVKEDNLIVKANMEQQYCDYLIDSCKANGSNLLVLENYVAQHSKRKEEIIKNIVRGADDGNIILFFHYNEYCKHIYDILKREFPDRHVLLMTGATTPKKRDEYKKMMKESDDVVLCANYGVSSTGLTLRLKYGVFVESFKSHVIVKQSLGRGLCLDPSKDHFELYDIIDCLPTGRLQMQGIHKCKIYKQEEFKYDIVRI